MVLVMRWSAAWNVVHLRASRAACLDSKQSHRPSDAMMTRPPVLGTHTCSKGHRQSAVRAYPVIK